MSPDVARLLDEASELCERTAPEIDPVQALRRRQELTRSRRRQGATLAFVVFVLLVQAAPRPAFGAPVPAATVAQPSATAWSADARD
jgi:hypothetical protein